LLRIITSNNANIRYKDDFIRIYSEKEAFRLKKSPSLFQDKMTTLRSQELKSDIPLRSSRKGGSSSFHSSSKTQPDP